MSASFSSAKVTVHERADASFTVRLEGSFRPAWMAGLCAGLGEQGVSIERVEASSVDGRWVAELQIVPPKGLDPRAIPYLALLEQSPEAQPGQLRLERYRLSESAEHGGTLKLELHAEDAIGFLGRVLSALAMRSLFPVALQIETRSRLAHDRFWLSGVGRAMPTRQSREVLERLLSGVTRDAVAKPSLVPDRFVSPNWQAPLDVDAVLQGIPADATIAGMFCEGIVQEARRRSLPLRGARTQYVPFEFYPLREHVALLVEACGLFFPDRPLRAALRATGRATPDVLLSSTLGRVVLGTAQDAVSALGAVARTYAVNVRPSHAEVIEAKPRKVLVRMRNVPFFLDCHHVGVLEGTMRYAGVHGTVHICPDGPSQMDFLCSW